MADPIAYAGTYVAKSWDFAISGPLVYTANVAADRELILASVYFNFDNYVSAGAYTDLMAFGSNSLTLVSHDSGSDVFEEASVKFDIWRLPEALIPSGENSFIPGVTIPGTHDDVNGIAVTVAGVKSTPRDFSKSFIENPVGLSPNYVLASSGAQVGDLILAVVANTWGNNYTGLDYFVWPVDWTRINLTTGYGGTVISIAYKICTAAGEGFTVKGNHDALEQPDPPLHFALMSAISFEPAGTPDPPATIEYTALFNHATIPLYWFDDNANGIGWFDADLFNPSALATVYKDSTLQWDILAAIAKDTNLRWNLLSSVVAGLELRWGLLSTVFKDTTFNWNILQSIFADKSFQWNILNAISKDTSLRWDVLKAISSDQTLQWNILALLFKDLELRWNSDGSSSTVFKDASLQWNILQAVSNDSDLRWNVLASIVSDKEFQWNLLSSAVKDTSLQWNLLQGVNKDLELRWNILKAVTSDKTLQWNILAQIAKDLELRWDSDGSNSTVYKDVSLQWNILATVTRDLIAQWDILGAVSVDKDFRWQILSGVYKELSINWDVLQAVEKDASLEWSIVGLTQSDLTLKWNIESDTSFPDLTGEITFTFDSPNFTVISNDPLFTIY